MERTMEHDEVVPLWDVNQVASLLGVSAAWVRDHSTRKQPRLKFVRVGKLLKFRRADVAAFIDANVSEAAETIFATPQA